MASAGVLILNRAPSARALASQIAPDSVWFVQLIGALVYFPRLRPSTFEKRQMRFSIQKKHELRPKKGNVLSPNVLLHNPLCAFARIKIRKRCGPNASGHLVSNHHSTLLKNRIALSPMSSAWIRFYFIPPIPFPPSSSSLSLLSLFSLFSLLPPHHLSPYPHLLLDPSLS